MSVVGGNSHWANVDRVAFLEYLSPTGKNSQKPVSNINANITAEIQTDIARKGKLKGKA